MCTQWTPEKLDELSTGLQECRLLLTAAELDLFTKLKKDRRTVDGLCRQENWNERALRTILDALTSLGLLSKSSGGLYRVPECMRHLSRKEEMSRSFP